MASVSVDVSAMKRLVQRVQAGASVLGKPFAETRGVEAARIMRFGPKGVQRQFVDTTEYRLNQSIPWAKTKPFGSRKAGKTMLGSGGYKSAFLGGAGAITRITPTSVEIGVSKGLYPQVAIHQGRRSSVTVKPKARTRGGKDWKMRFFLGLTYGVWISKKRLERGLKIPRRRVSVSSDVRRAVGKMVGKTTRGKLRLTTRSL
jgi:hypothetical protein